MTTSANAGAGGSWIPPHSHPHIEGSLPTIRAGTITVTALETTKAVVFAAAMPTNDYSVVYGLPSTLATVLSTASKTVNGFTLGLSIGVAATLDYIAVSR